MCVWIYIYTQRNMYNDKEKSQLKGTFCSSNKNTKIKANHGAVSHTHFLKVILPIKKPHLEAEF